MPTAPAPPFPAEPDNPTPANANDPAEQGHQGTRDQPTDEDVADWLPYWPDGDAASQSDR